MQKGKDMPLKWGFVINIKWGNTSFFILIDLLNVWLFFIDHPKKRLFNQLTCEIMRISYTSSKWCSVKSPLRAADESMTSPMISPFLNWNPRWPVLSLCRVTVRSNGLKSKKNNHWKRKSQHEILCESLVIEALKHLVYINSQRAKPRMSIAVFLNFWSCFIFPNRKKPIL